MEKNDSIEQVLDCLDNNIVYKIKNSPIIGFLLTGMGLGLFIGYSSFEWESNNSYAHGLFILGSICLIVGIIRLLFRKRHYVSAENHARLQRFEICFNITEKDKLVRLLESGNLVEIKNLTPAFVGALKLRVMASTEGQLCFSQVVAYISNEYINTTSVRKNSMSEYHILLEIVATRK